ncbi:hypothetical protein VTO73DRAFT_2093 [Trametes versicolor]
MSACALRRRWITGYMRTLFAAARGQSSSILQQIFLPQHTPAPTRRGFHSCPRVTFAQDKYEAHRERVRQWTPPRPQRRNPRNQLLLSQRLLSRTSRPNNVVPPRRGGELAPRRYKARPTEDSRRVRGQEGARCPSGLVVFFRAPSVECAPSSPHWSPADGVSRHDMLQLLEPGAGSKAAKRWTCHPALPRPKQGKNR